MNFNQFLPSMFKANLRSAAFPVVRRFAEHNVHGFSVLWVGDHNALQHLTRDGRKCKEDTAPTKPGEPCLAFVTPRSLLVDIVEVAAQPTGITESSIAQAIATKPQQFLKKHYDAERAYHCLPLDSRRILVFSVRATDVAKVEADVTRAKLILSQVFCGMALATKYALAEHQEKHYDANALVVVDQNLALTISFKDGRIEAATPLSVALDDPNSLSDLRKHIRKFVRNTSDLSLKGKALVFATTKSVITSIDPLTSPDYDAEFINIPTSELCFA